MRELTAMRLLGSDEIFAWKEKSGAFLEGSRAALVDQPAQPSFCLQLVCDEWESEVLGRPSYRLHIHGDVTCCGTDAARRLVDALAEDCAPYVLLRLPSDQTGLLLYLQSCGFVVLETMLDFSKKVHASSSNSTQPCTMRGGEPGDVEACLAMIAGSVRSRYAIDPLLGAGYEELAYRRWLDNAAAGRERFVVALVDDQPAGFITAAPVADGGWRIGLLGVAAQSRGLGIAGHLVDSAVTPGAASGTLLFVGTAGANRRAARFYERQGFRLRQVLLTLRYCQT